MCKAIEKGISLFEIIIKEYGIDAILSMGISTIMVHYFPIWTNKTAECIAMFCIVLWLLVKINRLITYVKLKIKEKREYDLNAGQAIYVLSRMTLEEKGAIQEVFLKKVIEVQGIYPNIVYKTLSEMNVFRVNIVDHGSVKTWRTVMDPFARRIILENKYLQKDILGEELKKK
jgi:hypothetical protein